MTKSLEESSGGEERGGRCEWCQATLAPRPGPGRPRRFCRQGCRQQAYVARRTGAADDRRAQQQLVDRAQLETAQDRIAMLRQALDDLEREQDAGELADLDHAFRWLHAHAAEVASVELGHEPASRSGHR